MSTRCQIIVKDEHSEVWFYRHSDGYPEGTLPTLKKFLGWVEEKRIRGNAEQASGWLVIIGNVEYGVRVEPKPSDDGLSWKVGAYEPCAPRRHDDIEYLYTVDLVTKTISFVEI